MLKVNARNVKKASIQTK